MKLPGAIKNTLEAVERFLTAALAVSVLAGLLVFGWHFLPQREPWISPVPPEPWREKAGASEVLTVPDRKVFYWGRPDAGYSRYATRSRRKPVGIVVHHTSPKQPVSLVKYGHHQDPSRGNASFGYHFYIGRDGAIFQGAPLSRRTNHVKFFKHRNRRGTAQHIWSGNAIGVSLVGGCDPYRAPVFGHWGRCARETVTPAQLSAGLAVIRALQARYKMDCRQVFGHGELQTDRLIFEGQLLTELARGACALPSRKPAIVTATTKATQPEPSGS